MQASECINGMSVKINMPTCPVHGKIGVVYGVIKRNTGKGSIHVRVNVDVDGWKGSFVPSQLLSA